MSEVQNYPANTPFTVAELGGLRHGFGGDEYPNIVAAMTDINNDARMGVSEMAAAGMSDHLIGGNLAVIAHINRVVGVFLGNPEAKISAGDACAVINIVLEVDSDGSPTMTTLIVAPTVMFESFVAKTFGHVPKLED
jgi:hypothetical protein